MERALEIFRALADPTRLRIVALLRAMELSVGELAQVLGQSQPRVSRHVKILADAGLAERRKEGSWVFLGLGAADRVEPLLAALDGWALDGGPLDGGIGEGEHWARADIARLAAIRADRIAAAERYFAAHAEHWDAIRSLHVAEAEVEAAILRTVGLATVGAAGPVGRMVDIGTGTGRMIELLGADAASAIGIDRSPEMLRVARANLAGAGLVRADLRQGDMYALPLAAGVADLVVLHQVLHYAQQPASAIAEAARLLAGDGRLLVVDFAAHDREELRSRDAHVRLGFDDAQMLGWFAAAGLDGALAGELAGDALTVKLWLGRRPATAGAEPQPLLKAVS